jgi:PAS domain S-box-containing protein
MAEIRRETKLEVSNRMHDLGEILNNSWDGIAVIDDNGDFVYINDAFSPMLGYAKNDILKNNFNAFVHEEFKSHLKISLKKALRLGHLRNVKIACKRADKQKIYLNLSLSLMANKKYFVLNAQDITKRIERDKILDKYVLSFNMAEDGSIIHINDAFSSFIGYAFSELEGIKIFQIAEENGCYALMQAIEDKEEFDGEIEFITSDKQRSSLQVSTKFTKNKYGDILDVELYCLNLTKINNDGLQSSEKIETNESSPQSKIHIMSDTLSIISNRWGDSISSMNMTLNKLIDYLGGTKISKKAIIEKCQYLQENISEINDEISAFKPYDPKTSQKEMIDISAVVKNAINMFEVANTEHTISIEKDIEKVGKIESYPKEILEIMINIMKNSLEAFKFAGRKGGLLDISLHQNDDNIVIQIIDNAGDISHEIKEKVFEPYYSTRNNKSNPGLGLYNAKLTIEKVLKGRIEFINEDYTTSVIITLPKKLED